MQIDPIDGLIALGMLTVEQAEAAARLQAHDVGRFGRLALVGVDVAPLLPAVSTITGVPLAVPQLLAATTAPPLPPETQGALRALHACPIAGAPGAPLDVVLADQHLRPSIAALLGPTFRAWLAPEEAVRVLAARLLGAAPIAATASAPQPAQPAAPTHRPSSGAPVAPNVAGNELAAFVEGPRKRAAQLSPAALAAALAEKVDLADDEKRRILDLEAKLDGANPAELLGVAEHATSEEIKERYYELSRAFHPDAHFRKNLGSYKTRVNKIFRGLKGACDKLVLAAEARDHLDLEGGAVAAATQPASAAAPRDVAALSARGPRVFDGAPAGPSLELGGALPRREAPPARTPSTIRMPTAGPPAAKRSGSKLPLIAGGAAALVALILVVVIVARSGGGGAHATPKTPEAQQAGLIQRATTALNAGEAATAFAFASQAIQVAPTSNLAAQARVVRGRASIANGDRLEGFQDLEQALRELPAGDPARAAAEAALAKARP